MRTSRAVAVTAVIGVAAMNLLAACTPEDDSDTLPTPTPVPDPTPEPDFHCQIVWTEQNATDGSLVDVFVLDAPEADWIGGVTAFGGFTGFYQPGLDPATNHIDVAVDEDGGAVNSTADDFTLAMTFNGTSDGSDVTVTDAVENTIFSVGTDGAPTTVEIGFAGNPMDFAGVWSSRDVTAIPDLGTGTVDLVLGTAGAPVTASLGAFGSFAICYDAAAEAQSHPVNATRGTLQRIHKRR